MTTTTTLLGAALLYCCCLLLLATPSCAGAARRRDAETDAVSQPEALDSMETEGDGADDSVLLTVRFGEGRVEEVALRQRGGAGGGGAAGNGIATPIGGGRRSCAELCRNGLGGSPCGPRCGTLLPGKFVKMLYNRTGETSETTLQENSTTQVVGRPRFEVCQELCENGLGTPMCGCTTRLRVATTNWTRVCGTFCAHGSYRLDGCPACKPRQEHDQAEDSKYALLNQDLWVEWCNYQCSNGDGGAACNCDLAPLRDEASNVVVE